MAIRVDVNRDQYRVLYKAWKADHDDEGYDFPFFDMWTHYRFNADARFSPMSNTPLTLVFEDDMDAVEFKLKWL